jgi:general L-amino acid transport system substrate-binding protein
MHLIFDTETTGVPRNYKAPITDLQNWPRVVQIAWTLCDDAGSEIGWAEHIVRPDGFVILPERISKEPLAAVVRHGDDQFYDIVSWTIYTLFDAEEFGIDSTNVDSFLTSNNPAVRRFLGVEPGMGQALGVDQKYAYNIIKAVGNYAQIFEANIGSGSPIKLARGMNSLWKNGGMLYSPPAR